MSGEFQAAARLDIQIAPPGRRVMRFRPTVLRVEPNKELRWSGSLGIRWVFDGEHAFLLESIGGGNTRFRQEERFVGILASLIMRGVEKQVLASPDQQISLTDPDSRSMATSGRGTGVVG